MTAEQITPMDLLAYTGLDLSTLSDLEVTVLAYEWAWRLRPVQVPPSHDWRFCGYVAGRGFGKSLAIAAEITRRVMLGLAPSVALMAPNEPRVEEVQIRSLIDVAPPWFRPERAAGGLLWPNGVRANTFTPEAPGRSRSDNIAVSWLCEIVDWIHTKRREAFDNITTATRVGCAQVFWDTTSKGRNDLIMHLTKLNQEDPDQYPIIRGTTFDNPLLSAKYLRAEWLKYSGVRRKEELFGEVFSEAAGALWQQSWIDSNRVELPPAKVRTKVLSIDPALSDHASADEIGMVIVSISEGLCYVERDLSERMKPEIWGELAIEQHLDPRVRVAGITLERNHLGDNALYVIRSRARAHDVDVRVLDRDVKRHPMPPYSRGILYVREYVAGRSKEARASGPASETEQGHVKFVGEFPDLENELTSYEPGVSRSPNRYDALCYAVNELLALDVDRTSRARTKIQSEVAQELSAMTRTRTSTEGGLPNPRILPPGGVSLSVKGRSRRL